MRKLALVVLSLVGLFLIAAPASAGGCPRNTNCAVEMRPDIVRTAFVGTVRAQLCISQASWNALLSYWRKNGKTGKCFWGAQSTDHSHLTAKIYGPCGTVSVKAGKVYGYDSRIGTAHRWGPF